MEAATATAITPDDSERKFRYALAAILLIALILRIVVRAATGSADFYANGYSFFAEHGQNLRNGLGYTDGSGLPHTERPPLYALFLAATGGYRYFWPFLVIQSLVSTGTVICVALIARRLSGRIAALIAAAITALYPYYVRHDTALQEIGLLTFLTALTMLLLVYLHARKSIWLALSAGLILGLAILTRSTIAPMMLLIPLWLMFPDKAATPWGRRAAAGIAFLGAALLVLSPWLVRQHRITGHWILTSQFGRALMEGNDPDTFAYYPIGSIDQSRRLIARRIRAEHPAMFQRSRRPYDAQVDAWQRGRALAYITANPGRFVVNGLRKNLAAFGILPSPRHGLVGNLVYALSYGPVLALAVVGAWQQRRRWRLLSLFYAQFGVFIAGTAILWGHTSHRSYLDAYLILFAAIALAPLVARRFNATAGM